MKQSNEKVKLVQTRDGKNFLLPFIRHSCKYPWLIFVV